MNTLNPLIILQKKLSEYSVRVAGVVVVVVVVGMVMMVVGWWWWWWGVGYGGRGVRGVVKGVRVGVVVVTCGL